MHNLIYRLFQLTLFICVSWGGYAWYTWNFEQRDNLYILLIYFIIFLISIVYKVTSKFTIRIDLKLLIAFWALLVGSSFPTFGISTLVIIILKFLPLIVMMMDSEHIENHRLFLSKIWAIVLLPGLFLYLFIILSSIIPTFIVSFGDGSLGRGYTFFNYGVLLFPVNTYGEFMRFQSVMLEPGYLGSFLAFMLYVNGYNFKKWYNVVMLIALMATLSLAGIIISIVGYLYWAITNQKSIKKLLVLVLTALLIYEIGIVYNGGNNIINDKIIERLQFNDEKGIAGNNRDSYIANEYFEEYLTEGKLLFGVANEFSQEEIGGAGYKRFIMANGFVATFAFLFFYLIIATYSLDKKRVMGYILLIVLTFLQAAYPMSYSWLVPFFLLVGMNGSKRSKTAFLYK